MTQDGHTFREQTSIERIAARAKGMLPASLLPPLRRAYGWMLRAGAAEGLVSELPGGERVTILADHRGITWNEQEYAAFRSAVEPGGVVLDVGANLGAYSVLFGMWVGDRGRVFAFEPAPDAFAGLAAQVAVNDLTGRVSCHRTAISDRQGAISFLASGPDGGNRIILDGESRPDVIPVPTTTLDAFCRAKAIVPSLIKIDVEGAEVHVLRGARELVARAGAGLALFVEIHPHLWGGFGVTREDLEAELQRQQLVPERLDGNPDIWNVRGVCLRLRPCAS